MFSLPKRKRIQTKQKLALLAEGKAICTLCYDIKSINEFGISKKSSTKISYYCNLCNTSLATKYHKRWVDKNKDGLNAYARKRYKANPHQKRNSAKIWRVKQYGLSEEKYFELIPQLKNGPCDICGSITGRFNIDHDHGKKIFRGILCDPCNLILGFAKDNTNTLMTAIHYLNKSRA